MPKNQKEPKIWKKSRVRIVCNGKTTEVYYYEKPYQYDGTDIYSAKRKHKEGLPRVRSSLLRAQTTIRHRIWANVQEGIIPRFYTFTFAKPEIDLNKANKAWRVFARRIKQAQPNIRYVCVVEWQKEREKKHGVGSWHYHCLFFNLSQDLHKKEILAYAKRKGTNACHMGPVGVMWGQGYVDASPTRTQISAIRSVAAYVSKYLSKGTIDNRLKGQKVYFCSKGLEKPTVYHEQDLLAIPELSTVLLDREHNDMVYSGEIQSTKFGKIIYQQYQKK